MANDKAAWRRTVSAERFPVGMRPVKATLLALPMTPDGRVTVWRDQLLDATGLPEGTLKRHLARAVAAGWLVHEKRGGKGRRGVYRAAVPPNSGPFMNHNGGELWPTGYTTARPNSGPRGEPVRTDSASEREHEALDPTKTKSKSAAKGDPHGDSTQPVSPSDDGSSFSLVHAGGVDAGVRGRRVPGNPDAPQADHVLEPSPAGTVRRCECGTADVATGQDVCIGCFVDRIAQRRKKATA
jgi:hypothetical protein